MRKLLLYVQISQLIYISSESTTDCPVEQGGIGKYWVKFIPIARGQHKLAISSEQCTLEHSEFLVVVTCPQLIKLQMDFFFS